MNPPGAKKIEESPQDSGEWTEHIGRLRIAPVGEEGQIIIREGKRRREDKNEKKK